MGQYNVYTFEKKNFNKSLIKYRTASDKVESICTSVPSMTQDMLDLAENYNTLVQKYLSSDEWMENAINITSSANTAAETLKKTTINIVKDVDSMMEAIESDNRRLKTSVEEKRGKLGDLLQGIEAIGITPVASPSGSTGGGSKTDVTPTPTPTPTETPEVTPTPTPTPTETPVQQHNGDAYNIKAGDVTSMNDNYNTEICTYNGRQCRILYPKDMDGECQIVVSLNGAGQMSNIGNPNGGSDSNMNKAIFSQTNDNSNVIYIIPTDCSGTGNWDNQANANMIMDQVAYVRSVTNCSDNVGIIGHSWGTKGALYMMQNYPDTFNKGVLCSPYRIDDMSNIKQGSVQVFCETQQANGNWSGREPFNFCKDYESQIGSEYIHSISGGHGSTPGGAINYDLNGESVISFLTN